MLGLVLLALVAAQADAILDRVSEEAEAFLNLAPKIIGRETLRQRARQQPRRFRLRIGKSALEPPAVRYQEREIVSEYGFGTFQEAPEALHEFRTVISVDGRNVTGHTQARETLTLGITSDDDRLKRKLLRQFEKHGLLAAAVDFGQLIVLFSRRQRAWYDFQVAGNQGIGAQQALVLAYRQLDGPGGFTIFEGNRSYQARLEGELWVRETDFLPLRILISGTVTDGKHQITHRGTVDYFRSAYGVLLPASVRYQKLIDDNLMVESISSYTEFRMFAAEAEIRFETAEPPAPAKK
jgi:hypothetical protein